MGLTGVLMAVALVLLAASIAPRKTRQVAGEKALLRFTEALIREEQDKSSRGRQITSDDAVSSLKRDLSEEYAVATEHNRRIRRQRDMLPAYAGLCVIASVLTTLLLVTAASVHYFPR